MPKQLILFRIPGMTLEQYDQCWNELREAGMENPPGLIHHVGAQSGDTFLAAAVWESLEAFQKFGDTLMPIFAKAGITNAPPPEIAPVHFELMGSVEA